MPILGWLKYLFCRGMKKLYVIMKLFNQPNTALGINSGGSSVWDCLMLHRFHLFILQLEMGDKHVSLTVQEHTEESYIYLTLCYTVNQVLAVTDSVDITVDCICIFYLCLLSLYSSS